MSVRRALMGFGVGLLITVPCLWLAMPFGQSGAKVLFPYAMFPPEFPKRASTLSMILAASQLPVYGMLLGFVYRSPQFRLVVVILAAIHVLAVLLLPAIAAIS